VPLGWWLEVELLRVKQRSPAWQAGRSEMSVGFGGFCLAFSPSESVLIDLGKSNTLPSPFGLWW